MAADNKMWEGHRIIYPKVRNEYLASKKKSYSRPVWDEQKLEELEYKLTQALEGKMPITITLWSPDGPKEKHIIALSIKKKGSFFFLEAQESGQKPSSILLTDILDINQ